MSDIPDNELGINTNGGIIAGYASKNTFIDKCGTFPEIYDGSHKAVGKGAKVSGTYEKISHTYLSEDDGYATVDQSSYDEIEIGLLEIYPEKPIWTIEKGRLKKA